MAREDTFCSITNLRASVGASPDYTLTSASCSLLGEPRLEPRPVDHRALVRAGADLLGLVARRDLEGDVAALDLDDLGLRRHVVTCGRRGEMPYVDCGADRALARIEIAADGI